MEHDTLSFCHQTGLWGWTFGFLQFAIWFVTPTMLFATHHHAASVDIYLSLILWASKPLLVLAIVVQAHVQEAIPDPACHDIFGTTLALPNVSVVILGFYASLLLTSLLFNSWRSRLGDGLTSRWRQSLALLVLMAAITGLYINGLHTARQLILSLLFGASYGIVFLYWLDELFIPYLLPCILKDPQGLGWVFGTFDRFQSTSHSEH